MSTQADQNVAGALVGEALAAQLLAAAASQSSADLAERILASSEEEALVAVAFLGRSRQTAAAPVLLAIAEHEGMVGKALRKEARRALHRLRAVGLDVPRPSPPAPAQPHERQVELVEAWSTAPDGIGSRALSLLFERPLGGVYVASMVLNDVVGMKACNVEETTRKRANQNLASWRAESGSVWVQLPPDYAKQLVGEALELNKQAGFTLPQEYLVHQHALGNPADAFERAIVYDEISAAEVALNPALLEQSPSLLEEPELKGWFFSFDEVRSFALDLLQARQSQIVLSEQLRAERSERIVANAIRDVLTPPIQRALGRRLEEVAYVFARTDRPRQARLAVAATQRLSEGGLTLHPLLKAMMERSLELAGEVETATVPVELVRRSPYDPVE